MHIYLQIVAVNLCSSSAYAIDYWQYGMSGLETAVSKPKVTFRKSLFLWKQHKFMARKTNVTHLKQTLYSL